MGLRGIARAFFSRAVDQSHAWCSIGWCLTALLGAMLVSGCSSATRMSEVGTSQPTEPAAEAASIISQPANQSVPVGQAATFTVTATGTGPLNYQWSENGTAISGATGASYTITNVTAEDGGAMFAVSVSNTVNSVTSSMATLTVGPRSPQTGDLRFQQVDAPSEADQGMANGTSLLFSDNSGGDIPNATGSPLVLGDGGCHAGVAYGCEWEIFFTGLPPGQSGLTAFYDGGQYSNLASDLTGGGAGFESTLASSNSVITSLDLEPANMAYAVAWMQAAQTGQASGGSSSFDMKREVVSQGAAPDAVAKDAAQSRVVTAVSFDANEQVNLISYGWQGDTATVYDTQVVCAAAADVEAAATQLAGGGYILTAFGGDTKNGFLLVGTKVQGDTLPRSVLTFDQSSNNSPDASTMAGYAPVAQLQYSGGNGSSGGWILVYEK